MGRSRSRPSVQKRLREKRRAEKAALKREERERRKEAPKDNEPKLATSEDLEGYGMVVDEAEESD